MAERTTKRVLDPIDRVSEIIFGLLMALSFTGSLSVATGHDEIRTVLAAALGCNIAWGLVDGVMYLLATATERARETRRPKSAHALLNAEDYSAALGVFLLVTLATFPVVLPFLFISDVFAAMRVSNGIALVTLFIGGYQLGRHAGFVPWRSGLAMAAIGAVLVAAIIALGG
jgi:VIT1/CCC1 family predicted Fe2+/Mn2+ transporter